MQGHITESALLKKGYTISDAIIVDAQILIDKNDDGGEEIRFNILIRANQEEHMFCDFLLGRKYVFPDGFRASSAGAELIYEIMKTVGVDDFIFLPGAAIRVAYKDGIQNASIIGEATADRWFDYDKFLERL